VSLRVVRHVKGAMMEVGTVLAFLLQGAMIASVLALGLNASAAEFSTFGIDPASCFARSSRCIS